MTDTKARPYAVYDVYTRSGHFLEKRAAGSESEAIQLARLDGAPYAAVAKLAAGETCPSEQDKG